MACPRGHITGPQAAMRFGFSRSWCNTARLRGKLTQQACGHYLYDEIQELERDARKSGMVLRGKRADYVGAGA